MNPIFFTVILSFLTIFSLAGALLLILSSIWRATGRFDTYLKLLALAFVFLLFKNILLLFGGRGFEYWTVLSGTMDFLQASFFLLANIKLFAIIRSLSGEDHLNS